MQPVNRFALKEWAVVCAALASGRQTILLRKGGLHEESDRFRLEHDEFWLYPTCFHQDRDELVPDAAPLLDQVRGDAPPEGTVRLGLYAVVHDVHRIDDAEQLQPLEGQHVLAPHTVRQRFDYRKPGLWIITARIYRRDEPYELSESPHFAGCKSWVDLRNKLPTGDLTPVLSDADFHKQAASLRNTTG